MIQNVSNWTGILCQCFVELANVELKKKNLQDNIAFYDMLVVHFAFDSRDMDSEQQVPSVSKYQTVHEYDNQFVLATVGSG